jgi:hypothetical protein
MSPLRNWVSHTPSLASECAPPHGTKGGGGRHILLRMKSWGSPNSDDRRKSLAPYLLRACNAVLATPLQYRPCSYCFLRDYWIETTEYRYTEWQRPYTISTTTYKVVVYAPAERADTLPPFLLYPYVHSVIRTQRAASACSRAYSFCNFCGSHFLYPVSSLGLWF